MHTHHAMDYFEISVTDVGAAKNFYSSAFGWKFTDYGPSYAGIKSPDGGEVGGFAQVDEVNSGGALLVLFSEDLPASVTAVKQAGGTIAKEIFDFPGGRRFHFLDPSGNELAVWGEK